MKFNRLSLFIEIFTLSLCLDLLLVKADDGSFEKVVLKSLEGNLAVTIFKPSSCTNSSSDDNDQKSDSYFYESTRFEHGSMIGNITFYSNYLYGADMWRSPHDSWNVESGVGLASEFGFGGNGAYCAGNDCYWKQEENNITNGVLGYEEASPGDTFLKIGVGSIIKGSCPGCNGTEDYQFNKPYKFSKKKSFEEKWYFEKLSDSSVTMKQKAYLSSSLDNGSLMYGYELQKDIVLDENILEVTSTLTNLGSKDFHTPWYSHHFFTCDSKPASSGYRVKFLGLNNDLSPRGRNKDGFFHRVHSFYEESGVGSWSSPIANYAEVNEKEASITIEMYRAVEKNTKIKAEFPKNSLNGNFILQGCGSKIQEDLIYNVDVSENISMYGVNIYIEQGTISPEPLLLLSVRTGESISWTQRLQFEKDTSLEESSVVNRKEGKSLWYLLKFLLITATTLFLLQMMYIRFCQRSRQYSPI